MRKANTIEEKIVQQYAPDSSLLDLALERPLNCIKYVEIIGKRDAPPGELPSSYDDLLVSNLSEALLSPVDWVRERATILAQALNLNSN
jgi:hypothetical protein